MKSLHIGMFVEINKNRLSSEDMTRAISALEDSSDEKVYSLLFRKTKNPSTTSFLALFLGWLGLDCFYLGNICGGIGRIIITILCVLLSCLCHEFVDLCGPLFADMPNLLPYAQAIIACIAVAVYPIYLGCLIRYAIEEAPQATKEKNAKIFHLKCKEYKWRIK